MDEVTPSERAANVLRVEYGPANMTDWHLPINLHDLIAAEIKAAVEAERDACTKIALSWEEGRNGYRGNATDIAEEIRVRGEKA